jgi:hypothetical protein
MSLMSEWAGLSKCLQRGNKSIQNYSEERFLIECIRKLKNEQENTIKKQVMVLWTCLTQVDSKFFGFSDEPFCVIDESWRYCFKIFFPLQLSIDSPLDPITSIVPLIFVISVTSIKQGYEDWLRHRSDNEVNSTLVTVIRKGIVQVK